MPRLLALLALILLLPSCAAPPAPPIAAAAVPPTVEPSETPAPVVGQPTVQPSVTPVPPSPTPAPPTAVPASPTPAPPTATPLPRYDLVLLGGTLIDATGAPPLPDAAVAILDGRIVAVGRAGELAFSPDTPVRDVAGSTILPGLINAHAHISGLGDEQLRAWTRAGVTTVRDLAGPLDERLGMRDSILARGDPGLPRLLVTGPVVTVEGGYPFGVNDSKLRVAAVAVYGPDHARAETNKLIDAGVNQIKIAVSGRTDVSWPELSDAEIAAITETARARGVRVSAHVDRVSGLRRAVQNGISDAAHAPRDRIPDDLIALMVERGVALVPTIGVYEDLARSRGRAVEWRRITMPVMYDNLRRFAAAGGTLALGDDYGGVPGMPLGLPQSEIAHWLAAGLSPLEVIVAATRGSAVAAGLIGELGTVEPGKLADLLVVPGDPLSDISALSRPTLVLRAGLEVPLQ